MQLQYSERMLLTNGVQIESNIVYILSITIVQSYMYTGKYHVFVPVNCYECTAQGAMP